MAQRTRLIEAAALVVLLVAGLGLRLTKVDWDSGHYAHPDERHIVMVTATLQWPERWQDLLDPRATSMSPFFRPDGSGVRQPTSFAYGHMPLYLLKGVTSGLQALSRPLADVLGAESALVRELARATDHQQMTLIGRIMSALFDAGTIVVVYALGRLLFGRRAGLLAAALLAFTVLHIQLAHFYAVDSILAFFVMLTLYWSLRLARGGGRRAAVLSGVFLALAVASKSSAAPLALAWFIAFALRDRRTNDGRGASLLLWSGFAGIVAFVLVSPYVLLDLRLYLDSLGFESRMVRGTYDLPYTRQYRGTPAFVYPILQQLRWGMGWLPGLLGFAGLGWGAWRVARRSGGEGELLLVAWALPYFLLTGGFMVKFMRYMAPLVPVMLVLAGGMVVHLAGRWPRWRAAVWGLAAAALVYAVLWSVAFTAIYRAPFTRHQASIWIYNNIPTSAVITKEEWDDQLPYPVRLGQNWRSPGEYESLAFPLQEPDDPRKVEMLVDRLTRADYIIVSSNRFYGWLPRLSDRYPVSNRYYELLFAEQLGFELVREFTSYPRLGPFQFVDDGADESFTVYDHPKVLIFQRTARLSEETLRGVFVEALAEGRSQADRDALLLPVPVEQYPSVADFGWNDWAGDGAAAVVWWWVVATAVGLLAWPLLHWLAGGLWAGAWPLARVFGLVLVSYPAWLLASTRLAANTVWTILGVAAAMAAVSAFVAWRTRRRLLETLRRRRPEVARGEVIALAGYLLFIILRLLNPDLWHPWWGGERPMEMGFLLATLKSAYFPPYDPFYAGGYINYYYYGLYVVGNLIKLSGIAPEVAFNLALASTFSATVAAAATLAASLARSRRTLAAVWAALLVGVLGNLDGGLQFVRRWGELGGDAPGADVALVGWLPRMLAGIGNVVVGTQRAPSYDFWGPTRVIPDTINEFPFFSFLYGDLHPHIIDMAVILLGLALVLVVYRDLRSGAAVHWAVRGGRLLALVLVIGTALATNTWDAPLLLAAVAGALLLGRTRLSARSVGEAALAAIGMGAAAMLIFRPFLAYYEPPPGGIGLTREGSPMLHFLRIWGLFALVSLGLNLAAVAAGRHRRGVAGMFAVAVRRRRRLPRLMDLVERRPALRRAWRAVDAVLLVLLVATTLLVALGRGAAALSLLLAMVALLAAWSARGEGERFAAALLSLGWLVLLGTELFYLKDWLAGGPAYRMNTVFKFGVQAWLVLAVGCGAQAALWWRAGGGLRRGWRAATLALVLLAAVYPVLGTPARVSNRFPNGSPAIGTLNGLAFMEVGSYFWPDESHPIALAPEREALEWLRRNVPGTPVVAEAAVGYYREGGQRVAAYTGLPIPLGPQHEPEQRPKAPLGQRSALVRHLYETPDPLQARQVMAELGVSYVYLGQLERIAYGEGGVAKFEELVRAGALEAVFRNEMVVVYRVL